MGRFILSLPWTKVVKLTRMQVYALLVYGRLLTHVRIRLAVTSYEAVRLRYGKMRESRQALGRLGVSPADVVWAGRAWARTPLGAHCLSNALTAHLLLRDLGVPSTVRIGVRRSPVGRFEAHAWLMTQESVLLGGPSSSFTPLTHLEIPLA